MKKIFLSFLLLLFFPIISKVFAQSYEHIENFDTNIQINSDGTINVSEDILYDFGTTNRHGIFRNIPFTKVNENNKRVDLEFENFSVTDENNKSYKFETSTENEQIILKIGDPNSTITGTHTYNISYKVSGAIGYFKDYDELYWNSTGTQWDVPITNTKTLISFPDKIEPGQSACFTGAYQSTYSNCEITPSGNKTLFAASDLNPYEGMTVVTKLKKGSVAYLPAEVYVSFWEKPLGKLTFLAIILAAVFWYLILPIILVVRYFKHGRDPYVGPAVTAWYDPPVTQGGKALSPTETGSLIDESVETRDIFAAIIDLARRGYIKIIESKKNEFSLEYIDKPKAKDTLQSFEKKLLDGIFEDDKKVELKDVKFYETIQEVEKIIYKNLVADNYFNKSPKETRTKYYALGAISLITFNLVLAFVAFFFGRIMPRKTLFGAQQANVARGMKNFLNSQERQLNYQGSKQLLFEKLLPFAVAFGVEKNWAKRFETFDLKNPEWYQGYSGSNFSALYLANSLSSSYRSFSVSSTPPSSSSSSGFGGGGFSGGGGGGGGGGSW